MSTTYIANIVAILVFVLPHFGITIADPNTLTGIFTSVAGAIAAIWVFYGRYRAGGISIFGLRKV